MCYDCYKLVFVTSLIKIHHFYFSIFINFWINFIWNHQIVTWNMKHLWCIQWLVCENTQYTSIHNSKLANINDTNDRIALSYEKATDRDCYSLVFYYLLPRGGARSNNSNGNTWWQIWDFAQLKASLSVQWSDTSDRYRLLLILISVLLTFTFILISSIRHLHLYFSIFLLLKANLELLKRLNWVRFILILIRYI